MNTNRRPVLHWKLHGILFIVRPGDPAAEQKSLSHDLTELHADNFKVATSLRHLGHEKGAGIFPEALLKEHLVK
jgi:hypothetical protein